MAESLEQSSGSPADSDRQKTPAETVRARGLKIPVSAVRFRLWARLNAEITAESNRVAASDPANCAELQSSNRPRLPTRFWSKVDVRGADECWPWTGGLTSDGYGRFRIGGRQGYMLGAHRLAYELEHGPLASGAVVVRHRCDNPRCCNPAHLIAGTHADNMRDMAERGRSCKDQLGSKGHNAKLTEADVATIRADAARGVSQKELRLRYGLSKGSVCDIVNRRTWTHVA